MDKGTMVVVCIICTTIIAGFLIVPFQEPNIIEPSPSVMGYITASDMNDAVIRTVVADGFSRGVYFDPYFKFELPMFLLGDVNG